MRVVLDPFGRLPIFIDPLAVPLLACASAMAAELLLASHARGVGSASDVVGSTHRDQHDFALQQPLA